MIPSMEATRDYWVTVTALSTRVLKRGEKNVDCGEKDCATFLREQMLYSTFKLLDSKLIMASLITVLIGTVQGVNGPHG